MKYLNPYRLAINFRNYLYRKEKLASVKYPCPVISVGNLTTGGTGKTPVVIELVELLNTLNKKNILIISKSYRAKLRSAKEVTSEAIKEPGIYGDEACMIKQFCPQAHVWSGPNKTETLKAALAVYPQTDVVIVDDGFSHRKIQRDLDIVLVDVSQPMSHYRLLPRGHLREDIDNVSRANLVILTKVNSADSATHEWFKNYLKEKSIACIEVHTQSTIDTNQKEVFLFTAIGNPTQLKKQLNASGYHIVSEKTYRDHHHYTEANQVDILNAWKKFPKSTLITTAKDVIKITNSELRTAIKVISLKVQFSQTDKGLLDAKVSSIF